jgi:hypothetical protein
MTTTLEAVARVISITIVLLATINTKNKRSRSQEIKPKNGADGAPRKRRNTMQPFLALRTKVLVNFLPQYGKHHDSPSSADFFHPMRSFSLEPISNEFKLSVLTSCIELIEWKLSDTVLGRIFSCPDSASKQS